MGARPVPVAARRGGIGSPRVALAFLTRLPVGDGRPLTAAALSGATAWFPAVGALVGAIAGAAYLAGDLAGLPPGPSTVLALTAAVLLTGGLHEDGLADVADAAGAHVDRERRLEIMRDPRVGTFGALALGLALLLAYSTLSTLEGERVVAALVAGHALGRWTTLPLSRLPSARSDGSGALVRAPLAALAVGSVVVVAVVLPAAGLAAGTAACIAACVLVALAGWAGVRRFGGMTGDTFGATTKVVEVATYAVLVGVW